MSRGYETQSKHWANCPYQMFVLIQTRSNIFSKKELVKKIIDKNIGGQMWFEFISRSGKKDTDSDKVIITFKHEY